jgi:hypothetical protein
VRYSEAVARAICERMAAGEPWSRICEDRRMPAYAMLYAWKRRHPDFAERVRLAMEAAADRHMDAALEISEEVTKDTVPQAKVRIETLKARTARLDAAAKRAEAAEGAPAVFHIEIVRFGRELGDDA